MADLRGFGVDYDAVDEPSSFDPLPAGVYSVMAIQSELKTTKDGTGEYLEIRWEVVDGPHTRRLLFSRLNLRNANPTAVKIANKDLRAIVRACGLTSVEESSDFHHITIRVKVKVSPPRGGYEASNDITAYERADGAAPAQATAKKAAPPRQAAAPAPAAPPTVGVKKPWET